MTLKGMASIASREDSQQQQGPLDKSPKQAFVRLTHVRTVVLPPQEGLKCCSQDTLKSNRFQTLSLKCSEKLPLARTRIHIPPTSRITSLNYVLTLQVFIVTEKKKFDK